MMARREWHVANGYGVLRLIAPRGSRRAFEVRDLLERNLIPVRWYDVDTDDESAAMLDWLRDPARGDAGPRAQHRGAAQPVGRPGRARPRPARGDRRRAVRPRRARRRAGRARRRRVRRLRGPAHARRRGVGARRPGRHEHADRELHRLPDRHLRHRADAQGDAAGAPLRRGALELPPRGRARARARGARARRPRRRPARARAHGRRRDRRALARRSTPTTSSASPAPASTTPRWRPTPSAAAART